MEEDEEVCRVCHGPGEDRQPLYHPCKCSGSIKWVHQVAFARICFGNVENDIIKRTGMFNGMVKDQRQ